MEKFNTYPFKANETIPTDYDNETIPTDYDTETIPIDQAKR